MAGPLCIAHLLVVVVVVVVVVVLLFFRSLWIVGVWFFWVKLFVFLKSLGICVGMCCEWFFGVEFWCVFQKFQKGFYFWVSNCFCFLRSLVICVCGVGRGRRDEGSCFCFVVYFGFGLCVVFFSSFVRSVV